MCWSCSCQVIKTFCKFLDGFKSIQLRTSLSAEWSHYLGRHNQSVTIFLWTELNFLKVMQRNFSVVVVLAESFEDFKDDATLNSHGWKVKKKRKVWVIFVVNPQIYIPNTKVTRFDFNLNLIFLSVYVQDQVLLSKSSSKTSVTDGKTVTHQLQP